MGKKGSAVGSAPGGDDQFKAVELPVSNPKTAILALSSDEPAVVGTACQALNSYAEASDKARDTLVEAGALPPLVSLLNSDFAEVRQQASLCLGTCTQASSARIVLRKADPEWFDKLSALLAETNPICNENAAYIVANMATEFSGRKLLSGVDIVGNLTALLESPEPSVLLHVTKALEALLVDFSAREQFADSQGLNGLSTLLDSDYNEIQRTALRIVALASKTAKARQKIYDTGFLTSLVAFVGNKDYHATHELALKALSGLLGHSEALKALVTEGEPDGSRGPLRDLVDFAHSEKPDIKVAALECLTGASRDEDNRRYLLIYGCERSVCAQLLPSDPKQPINYSVSTMACKATAALAAGKTNSEKLGDNGCMPPLAKLLSGNNEACTAAACQAVAVLCARVPANRKRAHEAGITLQLVDIMAGQNTAAKPYAAAGLSWLARDPSIKQSLQDSSLVSSLVAALKLTGLAVTELQKHAAMALAVLCLDQPFRAQLFQEEGAIEAICSLIPTGEAELRTNICKLVKAACTSTAIAACFYTLGASSTLRMVQHHLPTSNPFVDAALAQLHKTHLSARFACEGHLGATDNTSKGIFYDPGAAKSGQMVPSLSDLRQAAVSPTRPVLLIALATELDKDGVQVDGELRQFVQKVQEAIREQLFPPSHGADGTSDSPANEESKNDADGTPDQPIYRQSNRAIDPTKRQHVLQALATAADMVCERMGGAVPVGSLKATANQLALADLKAELNSNVIPIGKVLSGGYRERSLLFKAICDALGVATELVRGQFGTAYNLWYDDDEEDLFVIDVCHQPGRRIKTNMSEVAGPRNVFVRAADSAQD